VEGATHAARQHRCGVAELVEPLSRWLTPSTKGSTHSRGAENSNYQHRHSGIRSWHRRLFMKATPPRFSPLGTARRLPLMR
jgi:hypothetical protein